MYYDPSLNEKYIKNIFIFIFVIHLRLNKTDLIS